MNYTVQLKKSFEQALKDIESACEKNSFRVQHIHFVSDILKEKGFDIERYAIIEVCNPKFAHLVLSINKNYGSILPCRILLYEKEGKLYASSPKPTMLIQKLDMSELKDVAIQVEETIKNIILEIEK